MSHPLIGSFGGPILHAADEQIAIVIETLNRLLFTRQPVQLRALKAQILEFDRRIMAWHRSNATSKRLDAIPSVGPALATALVASIGPLAVNGVSFTLYQRACSRRLYQQC